MASLPDQFDLWVRKARTANPERQVDFVLGSMFALNEWFFLNQGSNEKPVPTIVDLEEKPYLLVFSSTGKIEDLLGDQIKQEHAAPSIFAIKTAQAVDYCAQFKPHGCVGILVNPGDYSFAVDFGGLENFNHSWKEKSSSTGRGFWIPNMTTEEEDFWQEHKA